MWLVNANVCCCWCCFFPFNIVIIFIIIFILYASGKAVHVDDGEWCDLIAIGWYNMGLCRQKVKETSIVFWDSDYTVTVCASQRILTHTHTYTTHHQPALPFYYDSVVSYLPFWNGGNDTLPSSLLFVVDAVVVDVAESAITEMLK